MAVHRSVRVLLTGWFSFPHGEVTAGDVLALDRVRQVLEEAGIRHDTAWSPGFRPDALHLEEAAPTDYSHLVFVCGPLHGPLVAALHRRYTRCFRIAVGTSVLDPEDPAATGFHQVLARDAPGSPPTRDLAAAAPVAPKTPVVGVILTVGQHEYGELRRHAQVARTVTDWLATRNCARIELDTRLDIHDWRLCARAAQVEAVIGRTDFVVTDRLHGLVLALRAGVPALAVDPVAGGAKVSAQARACRWPALVPAEALDLEGCQPTGRGDAGGGYETLDRWWAWCLGPGRSYALNRRVAFARNVEGDGADGLVDALFRPGKHIRDGESPDPGVPSTGR